MEQKGTRALRLKTRIYRKEGLMMRKTIRISSSVRVTGSGAHITATVKNGNVVKTIKKSVNV
jgi:phosphoribosylaminoimidazole (AIR) synthetase